MEIKPPEKYNKCQKFLFRIGVDTTTLEGKGAVNYNNKLTYKIVSNHLEDYSWIISVSVATNFEIIQDIEEPCSQKYLYSDRCNLDNNAIAMQYNMVLIYLLRGITC